MNATWRISYSGWWCVIMCLANDNEKVTRCNRFVVGLTMQYTVSDPLHAQVF
jgi:hypothetical protein